MAYWYKFASFVRWRFLSSKKIWIENRQSQPTSMSFWTAHETNTVQYHLWLAQFCCSQVLCLAVSDPVCSNQNHFSVNILFIHVSILCWYISWNRKRTNSAFENSKIEDRSRKTQPAHCLGHVATYLCSCGLAVIFRGFILYLIGCETISISKIHGFTGKTTV